MRRLFSFLLVAQLFLVLSVHAKSDKLNFTFKNAEMTKVIETLSRAMGKRFVVSPQIAKQKLTIISPEKVTSQEAYKSFVVALAAEGIGTVEKGDIIKIRRARELQRDDIEVVDTLPTTGMEKLVTWVYKFKHANASTTHKELRMLISKDGEVAVSQASNSLIFTDWLSNLNRVKKILERIDQPKKTK